MTNPELGNNYPENNENNSSNKDKKEYISLDESGDIGLTSAGEELRESTIGVLESTGKQLITIINKIKSLPDDEKSGAIESLNTKITELESMYNDGYPDFTKAAKLSSKITGFTPNTLNQKAKETSITRTESSGNKIQIAINDHNDRAGAFQGGLKGVFSKLFN